MTLVASDLEVGSALTDIIVRVVDCDPAAVVPEARLKDLGVDSLAIVEIAEGVEQRLGRHVTDDEVDRLVTVQDLVDVVERPQEAQPRTAGPLVPPLLDPDLPPEEVRHRKRKAMSYAAGFVGVGLVLGVVGGFGLAAVGKVLGLGTQDVPQAQATTPAPVEESATPTPTPTRTTSSEPQPELTITPKRVAPGERMTLSGRLPSVDEGTTLQVQTKDGGGGWTDFPVTVQVTDARGTFTTQIYTTRTGDRQVRLLDKTSNEATPAARVTVG